MHRPPVAIDKGDLCWYALASSRAQIAVQFGRRVQREPSVASGTVASPPLVDVEL